MSSLEHGVKISRVPEVYVPNNNNKTMPDNHYAYYAYTA